MVDTAAIAKKFAEDLVSHRNALAGKAEDAQLAQATFEQAATAMLDQRSEHRKDSAALMETWKGSGTDDFERHSSRLSKDLHTTAGAGTSASKIVAEVSGTLTGGHTAAQRLVDEYVSKASAILNGSLAATGAGSQASLVAAVGQVTDLANGYVKESAGNLRGTKEKLEHAAKQLRALEKDVEHDGIGDPRKGSGQHTTASKHGKHPEHKHGKGTKPSSGGEKVHDILKAARSQLGYHEVGDNGNKFGPKAPWCSSFATWAWRKAGVNIGLKPFTGDVYKWGQQKGTSYDKGHLKEAKPGDVLLFGTGPTYGGSHHIGIVEKVNGNQVTLIEGNSSDRVQRVTHTLSSSTFYGGVHPK